MFRRTRKNPTATIRDFTEGDLVPAALNAELASRAFGLADDGEGGVVFASDGVPTGGPSFEIGAGWSAVVGRPARTAHEFGAVGDYLTNDLSALNDFFAAGSALAAEDGERVKLIIPPGIYRCGDRLLMQSNIVVENQGVLLFDGGDAIGEFLLFLGVQNVEFYGGVVSANRQGNDNAIAIGTHTSEQPHCENILVHHLLVKDAAHGGSHIADITDTAEVGWGGGKGITIQHGGKDVLISDVVLDNCDLGFSHEGKASGGQWAQGVMVNNMIVRNSKYCGLFLASAPSATADYARVSSLSLNNVELVDCGTGQTDEETPQDCADLFGSIVTQGAHFVQAKNIRVKCNNPAEKMTVFRGAMRFSDWDVQAFCAGTLVDLVNSAPYAGKNPVNSTSRYNSSIKVGVTYDAAFEGYLLNSHATYWHDYSNFDFSVLNLAGGAPTSTPVAQYVNGQKGATLMRVTDLHAGKTTTVQDGTPVGTVSAFADFIANGLAIDDDSSNSYTKIGPTRNILALVDATGSAKAFVTSSGFLLGSAGLLFSGNTGLFFGAGSPEGVVAAGPGSGYLSSAGGTNTTMYVKETGTGNTGWVAK